MPTAFTELSQNFLALRNLRHLIDVKIFFVGHVGRVGRGQERVVTAAGSVELQLQGQMLVEQGVVRPLFVGVGDLQAVEVVFFDETFTGPLNVDLFVFGAVSGVDEYFAQPRVCGLVLNLFHIQIRRKNPFEQGGGFFFNLGIHGEVEQGGAANHAGSHEVGLHGFAGFAGVAFEASVPRGVLNFWAAQSLTNDFFRHDEVHFIVDHVGDIFAVSTALGDDAVPIGDARVFHQNLRFGGVLGGFFQEEVPECTAQCG